MYDFQAEPSAPALEPQSGEIEEEDEPMFCPFLRAECNQNCALLNEDHDGTLSCALSDIAESLDNLAKGAKLG